MLAENLYTLRRMLRLTQEAVAERIGVSRQAVAKWEAGETTPDIANCAALAELYGVSLDALVTFSSPVPGLPAPPRGKHLFGTAVLEEDGRVALPLKARQVFGLCPGDRLMVLGDEGQGIALVRETDLLQLLNGLRPDPAPGPLPKGGNAG